MKRSLVLLLAAGWASAAFAQGPMVTPVRPETLRWQGPPDIPELQAAWILGAEQESGPYLLRVRLASKGLIPPHTHPDERNTTVLSGTIYVGLGETFDPMQVVAVPAGAVYVAPANRPHFIWARDGAAEYQEGGFGPTASKLLAH